MIFQLVLTWGSETEYGKLLRLLIKMHCDECGMKLLVDGLSSRVDISKLLCATLDYFLYDCISHYCVCTVHVIRSLNYQYQHMHNFNVTG